MVTLKGGSRAKMVTLNLKKRKNGNTELPQLTF